MKKLDLEYRFYQLQKLNDDIPFESVISWVYTAQTQEKIKWWRWWEKLK